MSYSKDLRERAVKYYKSGHTLKETSEIFGAGINTISQWVKKYKKVICQAWMASEKDKR